MVKKQSLSLLVTHVSIQVYTSSKARSSNPQTPHHRHTTPLFPSVHHRPPLYSSHSATHIPSLQHLTHHHLLRFRWIININKITNTNQLIRIQQPTPLSPLSFSTISFGITHNSTISNPNSFLTSHMFTPFTFTPSPTIPTTTNRSRIIPVTLKNTLSSLRRSYGASQFIVLQSKEYIVQEFFFVLWCPSSSQAWTHIGSNHENLYFTFQLLKDHPQSDMRHQQQRCYFQHEQPPDQRAKFMEISRGSI